ncbi:hypothetical protein D3C86_1840800 [compost metagenome]
MVLEDLRDDGRHTLVLEHPLVDALPQVGQARYQTDLIAGQTPARIALANTENLTMNTGTLRIETQKRLAVQQAFEIDVRSLADQFDVKTVWLADGLPAGELKHVEFTVDAVDDQREAWLISRSDHPMCLCRMKASDSA